MRARMSFIKLRPASGSESGKGPDGAPAVAETAAPPAPAKGPAAEATPDGAAEVKAEPPRPAETAQPKAARLVEAQRDPTDLAMAQIMAAFAATRPWHRPAGLVAGLAVAAGLGFLGGRAGGPDPVAEARFAQATAQLQRGGDDLSRLAGDFKAVKSSVEALKGERDRTRGEVLAKQAQLSERIEKASAEAGARIGRMAEQLDRVEKAARDPARLQAVLDRLDALDKAGALTVAAAKPAETKAPDKIAAADTRPAEAKAVAEAPAPAIAAGIPTPPVKPSGVATLPVPDVSQTGSLGEARPRAEPRSAEPDGRRGQIEGYYVRDIDEGYALIEMRNGRFVEVAAGGTVPGIGRVEAIERRGRQWVVVTAKGFIAER